MACLYVTPFPMSVFGSQMGVGAGYRSLVLQRTCGADGECRRAGQLTSRVRPRGGRETVQSPKLAVVYTSVLNIIGG